MSEKNLFSEFWIKNKQLKNRIGVAPMTRTSSPGDSIPRKDVLDFLVRRAQKGVALVFTEAVLTDYESAQGYPRQSRMVTQRQIDAWRPVVQAIKDAGSLAVMQMFHCGRVAWPEINPAGRIIAPSPAAPEQENPLTQKPFPVPDEMSRFDIDHVIQGFAETAKGAVAAGFDGVEVHGAHGYLINSFLSAYSNKRTDDYGGSAENRFRLARQIIRAVREVMDEDRILTFRISNWGVVDMKVPLFDKDDWLSMIEWLDQEPVDAISVSTLNFSDSAFGTGQTLAELTRQRTAKPLMICGSIYDRKTADAALAHADIVLSGKSLLLNPNWVDDVRQNRPLEPRTPEEANVAYTDQVLPSRGRERFFFVKTFKGASKIDPDPGLSGSAADPSFQGIGNARKHLLTGQAHDGGPGNIAVVKQDPVSGFDFIAQKVFGLVVAHPVPGGSAVSRVFQILYGKCPGFGFHEPVAPGFRLCHRLCLLSAQAIKITGLSGKSRRVSNF